MKNERHIIEGILAEKQRGQNLTEREARLLAYSQYGTAPTSFALLDLHIHAEREE